jgi:hypothetical protein
MEFEIPMTLRIEADDETRAEVIAWHFEGLLDKSGKEAWLHIGLPRQALEREIEKRRTRHALHALHDRRDRRRQRQRPNRPALTKRGGGHRRAASAKPQRRKREHHPHNHRPLRLAKLRVRRPDDAGRERNDQLNGPASCRHNNRRANTSARPRVPARPDRGV